MDDVERQLAARVFSGGPAVLMDNGMSADDVKAFLSRPDVQTYMRMLSEELTAHESLMARQRFMARRSLARLAPQAVQLLADAMKGVVYETDADGKVVMEKKKKGKGRTAIDVEVPKIKSIPPASYQVEAAQDVLDRVGVHDKTVVEQGGNVNVQVLFGSVSNEDVVLDYGPALTAKEKILVRERVRKVIDQLSDKLPAAHQKLLEASGPVAAIAALKKAASKSTRKAKAVVAKLKGKKNGHVKKPAR